MKKAFKRFVGIVATLALCVSLLPAVSARAEEESKATSGTNAGATIYVTDVNELDMTEDQLLEAYMGSWDNALNLSKTSLNMRHFNEYTEEITELSTDWTFDGATVISGIPLSDEEYMMMWEGVQEPTSKVKALFFSNDTHEFVIYKGHDMNWGTKVLVLEIQEKDIPLTDRYYFYEKFVRAYQNDDGDMCIETMDVKEALLAAKEKNISTNTEPDKEKPEAPKLIPVPLAWDCPAAISEVVEGVNKDGDQFVTIKYEDGAEETHTMIWADHYEGYVVTYLAVYADGGDQGGDYPISDMGKEMPKVGDIPYPAKADEPEEPATETPTEEPKTEEPEKEPTEEPKVEEPKEEPVEDDREVVSKTKDGRNVYEGENVYVVKKGDCLWAIAKKLLGNGRRYKELFVRNGDIIEKAELIFPGQEVIIPTK